LRWNHWPPGRREADQTERELMAYLELHPEFTIWHRWRKRSPVQAARRVAGAQESSLAENRDYADHAESKSSAGMS